MSLISYISRVGRLALPSVRHTQPTRQISISVAKYVKEITVKEVDEKTTTVEGVYVKSSRENLVVKHDYADKKVCALCALDLNLKYTDVLILSQFLRSDGCMMPKRVTGLCNRQQKIVTSLVAMAQKAGIMPNLNPARSHKDPYKRYGSRKLNRYFLEHTIRGYKIKYYPPRNESKEYPMNNSKIMPNTNPRTINKLAPN